MLAALTTWVSYVLFNLIYLPWSTYNIVYYLYNQVFIKSTIFNLLQYHEEISGMEKEMSALLESASLFEVNVPDFKQLKQCRKEIKLLKTLWDYVIMVRSSIDDWKTTPWKEINVEQMDMDCKKFAKDIRYCSSNTYFTLFRKL